VGEILVDAKGVSRIYGNSRLRARDTFLLIGFRAADDADRGDGDLAVGPPLLRSRVRARSRMVRPSEGARVIPWRYHLVSIMAIFLALGLGVVVRDDGHQPGLVKNLNDQTDGLKQDLRQLQQEQQDLQSQLDTMNTFSDQRCPTWSRTSCSAVRS
jgi:hypothetical protein